MPPNQLSLGWVVHILEVIHVGLSFFWVFMVKILLPTLHSEVDLPIWSRVVRLMIQGLLCVVLLPKFHLQIRWDIPFASKILNPAQLLAFLLEHDNEGYYYYWNEQGDHSCKYDGYYFHKVGVILVFLAQLFVRWMLKLVNCQLAFSRSWSGFSYLYRFFKVFITVALWVRFTTVCKFTWKIVFHEFTAI